MSSLQCINDGSNQSPPSFQTGNHWAEQGNFGHDPCFYNMVEH